MLSTFLSILLIGCGHNNVLKEFRTLDYPSASGIEFANNRIYVMGDDANFLLILDENLEPVDSIRLYDFPEKRIGKDVKADLESVTFTKSKKLLLLGSGSLLPMRSVAWLIDPVNKSKDSIRLDSFYNHLSQTGLGEINIEGMTSIPGNIVMANRGNKTHPKNHLILTSPQFYKDQLHAPVSLMLAGSSTDSAAFNGVSGLAYSYKTDRLILSVSTEDTRNALEDGAIGKSYLWIINNFSTKKRWKAVNPDQVIDLVVMDEKFIGQKIESVCITKETRNFLHLVLVADNDNGSSSIFKIIIEKD
jgi:hypothetical protein